MLRKIPFLFFCLLWSWALSACRFDPQPAQDYVRCNPAGDCPNPSCVCGATGVCLPLAGSSPSACNCTKDEDGDGYIDADSCDGARDCDDTRADIHPGAFEACDEIDNDCDGQTVFDNSARAQLVDFPVLVKTSLPEDQRLQADSHRDLVFLARQDQCSTRMPYEIEHYDPDSGELFAWLRFHTLSMAIEAGHSFFLYWGSPIGEDQSRPNNTWSDDVLMVHHMGNLREGFFPDSSGAERHATPLNSNQPKTYSIIHEGVSFDGSSLRLLEVNHDPALDLPGDLTLEALVRLPGWVLENNAEHGEWQVISHHTHTPHSGYVLLFIRDTDGQTLLELRSYVDTEENGQASTKIFNLRAPVAGHMQAETWHHIAGRVDAQGLCLFVDGEKIGERSSAQEPVPPVIRYEEDLPLRIGASAYGQIIPDENNNLFLFDGDVDEVRVHRVARSDDWIRAQARILLDDEATLLFIKDVTND